MKSDCSVYSVLPGSSIQEVVASCLPDGDFRRICIKPNWVLHQEHDAFPINALITSPALIEAAVEACRKKYPNAEWITIGDVPLQSCDWPLMMKQCGLKTLAAQYATSTGPAIRFLDLRRERFKRVDGFLVEDTETTGGDPLGYREVILDEASFLDPISRAKTQFRVSDYDPGLMTSSHRRGFHRYLIAGSALEADLFINLPKMKTHQKAGITGALKNLVGINGQKAYLVHHRTGMPRQGGDEFMPGTPWVIRAQVRIRERLQKKSRTVFAVARHVWLWLKKWYGIKTEATRENLQAGGVYMAAGSWYGNDTVWRMIYDLNYIIRHAPAAGGHPTQTPQRAYVVIIDGLISGEGNGPLQPLPIESNLLIAADNPLAADMVMARLMGYDFTKIPSLCHFREFQDPEWAALDPGTMAIRRDDTVVTGLHHLQPVRLYIPPPGWKNHIEDTSAPAP